MDFSKSTSASTSPLPRCPPCPNHMGQVLPHSFSRSHPAHRPSQASRMTQGMWGMQGTEPVGSYRGRLSPSGQISHESRHEGHGPERPALTAAQGDLGAWPLFSAKLTSPKQPTSCHSTGPPPRLSCPFSGWTPAFPPAGPCRLSCSEARPYLDDPQGFAGVVFVQVVDVAGQGDAEEVVLLPQAA